MNRQELNNKANNYSKTFIQDNNVTFPLTKEMFIQYIKQAYKDGYMDNQQIYPANNNNSGSTPVSAAVTSYYTPYVSTSNQYPYVTVYI